MRAESQVGNRRDLAGTPYSRVLLASKPSCRASRWHTLSTRMRVPTQAGMKLQQRGNKAAADNKAQQHGTQSILVELAHDHTS